LSGAFVLTDVYTKAGKLLKEKGRGKNKKVSKYNGLREMG